MKLNGKWKLYAIENSGIINTPEELLKYSAISAEVPGNVELDLINAGLLPEDIYKGMNITLAEKYETYEWWYETEFVTPEHKNDLILRFDGVDCFAEYWLNGRVIGSSDNMLIEHEFDVTDTLNPTGKKNILFVKIRPAILEANHIKYDIYNIDSHPQPNADGIGLRKPPHCFGWDIMPRAVSAGIWKDVILYEKTEIGINQIHYHVISACADMAKIRFLWELDIPDDVLKTDIWVHICGKCGDSEFSVKEKVYFKLGKTEIEVKSPKLWLPKGYGKANIYDTKISVIAGGKDISDKEFNVGMRTVSLDRTATTDGKNGKFRFIINDIPVMCKGTNWVPLDAYHSRDKDRYDMALSLLVDIGCNMVRCWGGNVYEQDIFYDFCDRNGIMIWQDFTMACAGYSLSDEFCKKIENEAECVVRRLRTHPSIVLWAGDNECDAVMSEFGTDPTKNRLNREILPGVIHRNDNGRPYLPSSPYFDGDTHIGNRYDILSEYHLWGPRDYFKSDYYSQSKAHFVSEIGYHGCPSRESLEKFIDEDYLWSYVDNEQWNLHSSDQRNNPARVQLVANQIKQLFGEVPDNLDDFALASQISQAEAKKYFIERIRCKKPTKSGVIWWNLLDGWPQISDAVVDYYGSKKLAYEYIKASQQDFVIMADEINNWGIKIIASNDTLETILGDVTIKCDGEVIYQGDFKVGANQNAEITSIPVMYSDKKLFTFEWKTNISNGSNHYICGYPAFDFMKYKSEWLPEIKRLQNNI